MPEPGRLARGERTLSKAHLHALEQALVGRGWRVVAVHPGNDYDISATWEIQRNAGKGSVLIDFSGLDDMVCLPLEKSYGCRVRGRRERALYFRRVNKSRKLWEQELAEFVRSLDDGGDDSAGSRNA